MKKKPVIITIVIVAIAAILIGGGIYLYPHLVERTISQVVDNDMTDVVKIEMRNGSNGNEVELSDKASIEEIVGLVKDLKVKKNFDQNMDTLGGSLNILMTNSDGETIYIKCWSRINDTKYVFLENSSQLREISEYIIDKHDVDWTEEFMESIKE